MKCPRRPFIFYSTTTFMKSLGILSAFLSCSLESRDVMCTWVIVVLQWEVNER